MIFRIDRASSWTDDAAPAPGAYREAGIEGWLVRIETLDALIALEAAVGRPLIFQTLPPGGEVGGEITVYDDYVE